MAITLSGKMPLFINGGGHHVSSSINLLVWNSQVQRKINLFIRGAGVIPGAHPSSASLPLYLCRHVVSRSIPLFIRGGGENSERSLQMFISGAVRSSASIPLIIPGVVGRSSRRIKLYVHGF
jgi:hypothetical protein